MVDGVGYSARHRGNQWKKNEEKNERKEAHLRNEAKPNHFSDFHRAASLYRNGGYGWNSMPAF